MNVSIHVQDTNVPNNKFSLNLFHSRSRFSKVRKQKLQASSFSKVRKRLLYTGIKGPRTLDKKAEALQNGEFYGRYTYIVQAAIKTSVVHCSLVCNAGGR